MTLLPSQIEKIIALGGGVAIDASKYLPSQLERFAAFASQSGATLILYNCGKLLPSILERIAAFGKGRVIFKFEQ